MQITKSTCLDTFMEAWAALGDMASSTESTPLQVAQAESAQDQIVHDFIRTRLDSLEERTHAFAAFVEAMEEVIAKINQGGAIEAIKGFQSIVDEAKAKVTLDATAAPAASSADASADQ